MASRPKRRPAGGRSSARRSPQQPAGTQRDRIVDALMSLIAERGFSAVGLADIAERAGVSIAALRAAYDGKIGILADFARRTDETVLAGGPAEGEGARDRLFDIVMRRLDALTPHKAALKRLGQAARCDAALGCALLRIAQRSQKWMHAAAGIEEGGLMGAITQQGGVLVYADTLRVWLNDTDPGLAKTMKRLDEGLRRGEQAMRFAGDLCGLVPSFFRDGLRRRGPSETRASG
jgi:AcrR family transcriptional regulator